MGCVKTCLVFLVVLAFVECGRFGGSRSGGFSRGSSSRSWSSPSHRAPSSHYSPSPSSSYHSSSYNRPRPSPPPRFQTSRPSPPAYEAPIRHVTSRPVQSHRPSGFSTSRPYHRPAGSTARTHFQPAGPTSRPNYNSGSTRRPVYGGTTPRRHYTTARPAGFANLPPRPGSGPVGPPRTSSTSYTGPYKYKVVNKYNYHYPGYYSVPVAHHYPGYFYTPSYYHYGAGDTGSTALGFYLGYSFGRLTTPTYSHYSFYDGYRPRYDHYTVHHYYHNRDSVPQQQEIRSNTIVGCVGDSAAICPANTTSLCTSNGALMCVASAISTVPCSDNRQINCVTSTISCVNNTAAECKNANQGTTTISIPCVSKAEIYGDLKTVNNTIIPANATILPALNTTSAANSTVTSANSTALNNTNSTLITQYTQAPIVTTTPVVPHIERKKRETPQDYCVTVLALPAKRQQTQGEEFLNDAKFITEQFLESVWDL